MTLAKTPRFTFAPADASRRKPLLRQVSLAETVSSHDH